MTKKIKYNEIMARKPFLEVIDKLAVATQTGFRLAAVSFAEKVADNLGDKLSISPEIDEETEKETIIDKLGDFIELGLSSVLDAAVESYESIEEEVEDVEEVDIDLTKENPWENPEAEKWLRLMKQKTHLPEKLKKLVKELVAEDELSFEELEEFMELIEEQVDNLLLHSVFSIHTRLEVEGEEARAKEAEGLDVGEVEVGGKVEGGFEDVEIPEEDEESWFTGLGSDLRRMQKSWFDYIKE